MTNSPCRARPSRTVTIHGWSCPTPAPWARSTPTGPGVPDVIPITVPVSYVISMRLVSHHAHQSVRHRGRTGHRRRRPADGSPERRRRNLRTRGRVDADRDLPGTPVYYTHLTL